MPVPSSAHSSFRRGVPLLALPVVVALAYGIGQLSWYVSTPLGQVPVMDERENLALAEAIARHSLPPEPFYRAPGYPLILALFRWSGIPPGWLFLTALVLGIVLHGVNAGLVASIARAWFNSAAGVTAGLIYALHPVFVHFATQALDATPALTFFLAGLAVMAPEFARAQAAEANAWRWAAGSLALAAATSLRPNYLLPWLVVPILALARGPGRRRCLAAALAGVALFAITAGWQWRVSGHAGFLPWQGPYNLWAANRPGSHGRYYVQQHNVPSVAATRQNPARVESEYLYREETGAAAPDISTLNAHWQRRFLDYVTHHPIAWGMQLGRKTYALLNNWEQYNNKTFAFHQARSPWLRWNPLCWGVLFVLGVAGFARLVHERPLVGWPLTVVLTACASSVLLFFVSARFRLPLAALAAVLAGGAVTAPAFWRSWRRSRQLPLAIATVVAAGVTFSSFDGVRDRITFVQDHALLARAADTVGDDALAWAEARAALALQPQHRDALRLAVSSYFNLLILGKPLPGPEREWAEVCTGFLSGHDDEVPDLRAVAALSLWRAADRPKALAEWRTLGAAPSALAARLLVGDITPSQVDFSAWRDGAWEQPLVQCAALEYHLTPPPAVRIGERTPATERVARLFGRGKSGQ